MTKAKRFFLAAAVAGVVGAVLAASAGRAAAQAPDSAPVLLMLDKDAIDYGPPPHLLPENAVDPEIAGIGVREELRYFQSHLSTQVILTGGQNGNAGWFALRTVPSAWSSGDGATDGLENFALAGPGLGSPDENGDRESLLDNVQDVTPVRADGLALLVGRMVCAVVYSGDVVVAPGTPSTTSLKGATLGRIAFKVVALAPTDDPAFPNVQVEIAEGHEVCAVQLAAFSEAPDGQ